MSVLRDKTDHITGKTAVGFLPLARKTFDMDAAKQIAANSKEALDAFGQMTPIWLGELTTDPDDAAKAAQELASRGAKLLIIQTSTFVDGQFALAVAEKWRGPLVLWSVEEPSTTGRLRLNSLTGANLLANAFYGLGRKFKYVHGKADEDHVLQKIVNYAVVVELLSEMRGAKLGILGHYPAGYYPAEVDERELARLFGIRIVHFTQDSVFELASEIDTAEASRISDRIGNKVSGVSRENEEQLRSWKLYLAIKSLVSEHSLMGLALECWPAVFTKYKAAPCAAVSELCDEGIMTACETDLGGLISMIAASRFSGKPSYLGDLVRVNRERNSGVFWHCGAGACSLSRKGVKPEASVHPNRRQGIIYDFSLQGGVVTVSRFSRGNSKYRMLIMCGNALETVDAHYSGTSVEIQFERNISQVTETLFENGFEHHYAIGYGDHTKQLMDMADELGIEAFRI